jgi:hypothetical protein
MTVWDNFWPGLASTVASIVLGIPVAMWLERLIESRSERKAVDAADQQLRTALTVLRSTLDASVTALDEAQENLKNGGIPMAPLLDSGAWGVLQGRLERLPNVQVVHELAVVFNRIEEIRRLLIVYEQQFFTVQASMEGVGKLRGALVRAILKQSEVTAAEAKRLSALLRGL